MLDYLKIASDIDNISEKMEASGRIKEAYALDKIADTLEAMVQFPPEAIQMARELGITLNPQNAAEIVKKYLNPKMMNAAPGAPGMESKEALNVNPKVRQFAVLAMILANAFIANVQAKGKPITVTFPTGTVTYDAKALKQLERSDPASFSLVMNQYEKQQSQAQSQREIDETARAQAQKAGKPSGYEKPVKDTEHLNDDFGNTATLTTYTDGTKKLEGDIYHGGVSLRDKLTRSGEIPHEPGAKHLGRQ